MIKSHRCVEAPTAHHQADVSLCFSYHHPSLPNTSSSAFQRPLALTPRSSEVKHFPVPSSASICTLLHSFSDKRIGYPQGAGWAALKTKPTSLWLNHSHTNCYPNLYYSHSPGREPCSSSSVSGYFLGFLQIINATGTPAMWAPGQQESDWCYQPY